MNRLLRLARYAWAAPCSAVGLVLAALVLLGGGTVRMNAGALEAFLRGPRRGRRARLSGAITFGHVIVGRTEEVLASLRPHELEHVRQYERWGPVFFAAYLASSFFHLLRGRHPYWFNYFEVQARERSGRQARPRHG
ncbi:MAG: hypothetical protein EHM13_08725 [Acidobacteria bacterium]|nr:MAG: hypothetical protein EHM13_08725 [Acidobacteriota bacterium]